MALPLPPAECCLLHGRVGLKRPPCCPAAQEKDDLRKRTRQERLAELRSGTRRSWVELNRALPAVDAF